MKNTIITYLILLTSAFSLSLYAQMEERGLTRDGNDFVEDSLFVMAEAEYLKSLDIHDFDTNRFNMAFAMLGQEKFDEAIAEWESVEKSSDNKILQSFCVYNIGGVLAMQQKTDEALEKYKQALRYFPKNDVARHNYWLLKLIKDQNPQQQQQNQDQQDQDNKDKKDQDENQDQQNKDQQNQDQNSDQNESDKNKEDGEKDDKSEGEESEDDKSGDDKSDEEKDKDGESEDESEDDKSDEEKDDEGKSDEESDEDGDDKKDENGESDDEKDGDQDGDPQGGEDIKEGELSTGDALRLLESLDKEEDKTQEKIKAQLLKGKKKKKHEKDW